MEREQLSQRVGTLSERVRRLLQQAYSSLLQQPEPQHIAFFPGILEELGNSMEELQVSQEFLHQQNEELSSAYEALAAEQRRYQELFEFAPDGYLVTDIEGKIQEANRAASALLNVPQTYLVGKPLSVYISEQEQQNFRAQLAQMPQIERLQEWIVCLQPRQNQSFYAALTVTTVTDSQGNVTSLRWLVRDISDRKQLEEAQLRAALAEMTNQALETEIAQRKLLEGELRRQAEALAEANSLKDEFLAIVSHELRSPLNAILGFSQMLRTRQFDEAMSCRALETIERNARAQAQLVEDLLDISRIVRGKLTLNVQPVDLVDVIEAAINSVNLAATAKGIDIQTELDESAIVSGDGDRLQQVLWHLLTNAIKFTPSQGRIEVRLKQDDSLARIQISDTGQGIHPDFLPHVFDRFRQEEQATTRHHGGLGIGLSIVRQLVELHGGTVQADSLGEEQGTTFTIRLPLMVDSPDQQELSSLFVPEDVSVDDAQASLRDVSVLVVDDETDDRELLKIVLECAGAHVKAVASVHEALQVLQQLQPDVLVSDVRMPEQDGYSLIRQLRATSVEHIRQIPAIALTAYAPDENSKKAMMEGYQLYLPKPIEPDALVAAIASQLNAGAFIHTNDVDIK